MIKSTLPNGSFATLLVGLAMLAVLAACGRAGQETAQSSADTSGATVSVLSPAGQLGLVIDTQLRVVDVEPGGAAEGAGIERDDVLLALDGAPLTAPETARLAVIAASPGQALRLTVRRGADERTIDVISAPPAGRPDSATATPVPPDLLYL
jgi:S1-C subfamily serine protease